MTLVRLPDPKPEEWFTDYSQVMRSADWYGFRYFGYTYGNFWAERSCRIRRHEWRTLGRRRDGRRIYRCQRCGSQTELGYPTKPPVRGKW
jgi:hypothetical protein